MTTEQSESLAEATNEIARFTEILHRRIHGQLRYDLEVNLPGARVKRQEMRTHALRSGIVSAIGEWLQWDPEQITLIAAEILDDSNLHDLAGLLNQALHETKNHSSI
jgi:hypothetical protein